MAWRAPPYDPNAPKPRIIDWYSEDPNLTDEEAEQKRKEADRNSSIVVWGLIIFVILWAFFWGEINGAPTDVCLPSEEIRGECEP